MLVTLHWWLWLSYYSWPGIEQTRGWGSITAHLAMAHTIYNDNIDNDDNKDNNNDTKNNNKIS